jgi:fucose 4-O-acetylase-like acetyltransferase
VLERRHEGELHALAHVVAGLRGALVEARGEPLVGIRLDPGRFDERLTERPVRIVSAIVLIVAFLICYRYSAGWETDWLLWKQRYDESPLSATALGGVMQRGELLAIGLVLTFAALSLVPKRRSWTTRLGTRTIYTYLLHGYIVLILSLQFDVFNRLEKEMDGNLAVIITIVGAVIVANVLMTAIVAKVFRPVFEPKLTWMFRDVSERGPVITEQPKPSSTTATSP